MKVDNLYIRGYNEIERPFVIIILLALHVFTHLERGATATSMHQTE